MCERAKETAPVDAILLAGRDSNAVGFNSQHKFSLEMGEQDILEGVLEAIDKTDSIDKVFFVGPLELIDDRVKGRKKGYITIPDTGSLWGNLSETIEKQQQLCGNHEVLVICSDLPFLTAESMDWLIANSRGKNNLQIPVVPREQILKLSPTYETYYWPMREFPFKWSNNILLDINKIVDSRVAQLFTKYRETDGDKFPLSALRRIHLLQKHGGSEAVYALLLNYASYLLQLKFDERVPFSELIGKRDYEEILTRAIAIDSELLKTPFAEMVLDVDNHLRLGIFQRGFQEIKGVIKEQNNSYPQL
ncbi:NTP transferase domain-containing protein [bacterium]|nr:NTP transferase domain-containing protein [bacterium]